MKKHNILLFMAFLAAWPSTAQKPFQGRVTFSIAYKEFPEGREGMEYVLPKEATWFISGPNTRIESNTEVGGETTSLFVEADDSVTVLFELTGQRVFYRKKREESIKFRVAPRQKTMSWNGITLTKHVMQSASGLIIEAWCDTRYQNTLGTGYDDLKFLPLIFDYYDHGVKMRYSASDVDLYPIDETYFKIPGDRVRVSSRTLQNIVR